MMGEERCNKSTGIKLFGTTITLKERSHDEEEAAPAKKKADVAEKKPDKIVPCPRCKSIETKFCYFNNYNVNQPRHFCKACQRYWTAGGALRNVPVGAGRRKNKPATDQEGCMDSFEWQEFYGGFNQLFPAKRRRCASSNTQTC